MGKQVGKQWGNMGKQNAEDYLESERFVNVVPKKVE